MKRRRFFDRERPLDWIALTILLAWLFFVVELQLLSMGPHAPDRWVIVAVGLVLGAGPLVSLYFSIRALGRWLTLRRRRRGGLCRQCGYDLRAHAPGEKCPECGAVVTGEVERKAVT